LVPEPEASMAILFLFYILDLSEKQFSSNKITILDENVVKKRAFF
jgi:hypothetical protein